MKIQFQQYFIQCDAYTYLIRSILEIGIGFPYCSFIKFVMTTSVN